MKLAWHYKFNGGKSVAVSDEAAEVILIAEKLLMAGMNNAATAEKLSDGELADALLVDVGAKFCIGTPEIALVEEAVERLRAAGSKRCKNCMWWDRNDWSDYGEGVLECSCLKVVWEVGVTTETGSLVTTHPDFGCVHFEPKEQ